MKVIMTTLLPWILILLIDQSMVIETKLQFETEEACIAYGETLTLHILTDLQLTNHTVEPQCQKRES